MLEFIRTSWHTNLALSIVRLFSDKFCKERWDDSGNKRTLYFISSWFNAAGNYLLFCYFSFSGGLVISLGEGYGWVLGVFSCYRVWEFIWGVIWLLGGIFIVFICGCFCRMFNDFFLFYRTVGLTGFCKGFGCFIFHRGCCSPTAVTWLESRDRSTHEFLQSDVLDEFVHQVACAAVLHAVTPQIQLRQGPVQLSEKMSTVNYLFNCQRKVSTVRNLMNCQRKCQLSNICSTVREKCQLSKKCQLPNICSTVRKMSTVRENIKFQNKVRGDSRIGNY